MAVVTAACCGYSYYLPVCTIGTCSSCCDTGCCGYLGCRPGPIRRAVFGPCKWYGGCCWLVELRRLRVRWLRPGLHLVRLERLLQHSAFLL